MSMENVMGAAKPIFTCLSLLSKSLSLCFQGLSNLPSFSKLLDKSLPNKPYKQIALGCLSTAYETLQTELFRYPKASAALLWSRENLPLIVSTIGIAVSLYFKYGAPYQTLMTLFTAASLVEKRIKEHGKRYNQKTLNDLIEKNTLLNDIEASLENIEQDELDYTMLVTQEPKFKALFSQKDERQKFFYSHKKLTFGQKIQEVGAVKAIVLGINLTGAALSALSYCLVEQLSGSSYLPEYLHNIISFFSIPALVANWGYGVYGTINTIAKVTEKAKEVEHKQNVFGMSKDITIEALREVRNINHISGLIVNHSIEYNRLENQKVSFSTTIATSVPLQVSREKYIRRTLPKNVHLTEKQDGFIKAHRKSYIRETPLSSILNHINDEDYVYL